MSALKPVLPPARRGHRIAGCLLSVSAVLALAGCGAGESAVAGERPTATASPSASPRPTPSPTPTRTPSPSPSPSATPVPEPSPEPEPAAPAPSVVEAPRPAATVAPAPEPVPVEEPAPAPVPAVQASGAPSTAGAQVLFASVNSARSSAGLAPLAYSSALESVASGWTSSMAASGTLVHNPSFASQIPAGSTGSGENIGYAGGFADNAATIHDGWMDSPGHRANILGASFTQIGIGYVVDASGTAWATQVFAGY